MLPPLIPLVGASKKGLHQPLQPSVGYYWAAVAMQAVCLIRRTCVFSTSKMQCALGTPFVGFPSRTKSVLSKQPHGKESKFMRPKDE